MDILVFRDTQYPSTSVNDIYTTTDNQEGYSYTYDGRTYLLKYPAMVGSVGGWLSGLFPSTVYRTRGSEIEAYLQAGYRSQCFSSVVWNESRIAYGNTPFFESLTDALTYSVGEGYDETKIKRGSPAYSLVTPITSNGGGATHIAKVTGQLSSLSNNLSDILMVSGGGGGGLLVGDTDYSGKEAGGISGSGDNSADQSTGYTFGQGESGTNVSGGGSGLYGGYKGTSEKSGGAGSGYIGNSLLSNKKMVGYNVPTSSAESTKTESVNEASESPVSGKPKIGNGFARIKLLSEIKYWGFIEHMDVLDPAQRIEYIGLNKNYTPITIDSSSHSANYGSWSEHPIIQGNVPAMIKSDGTLDYYLNPNDYTKKADNTASDIADLSYNGGAFAYIPKHYKREYIEGNDRYVYISMEKLSDKYKPIGFIGPDNHEYKGAWIPMFYGTDVTQNGVFKIVSLANGYPTKNKSSDTQNTYMTNFCSQAKFFGGAIMNVITDLLTLFGKNSDIQAVFGMGNSRGYNSSGPNYGMKENVVVGGGQFYGTTDGYSLNKLFHSIVLGSYNQWQRDPYMILVSGRLKVCPTYAYDPTGADSRYIDTEIDYNSNYSDRWVYPHKSLLVPDFGAVFDTGPYSGSTTTGYADGFYYGRSGTKMFSRFNVCNGDRSAGPRAFYADREASFAEWAIGASPFLLSDI